MLELCIIIPHLNASALLMRIEQFKLKFKHFLISQIQNPEFKPKPTAWSSIATNICQQIHRVPVAGRVVYISV